MTARSVEQRSAERIRPAAEQTDRRPRRGRRPACAVGGAYPLCAQTFAERDTKKRGAPGCKQRLRRERRKICGGAKGPRANFAQSEGLILSASSPVRNVTARSVEQRSAERIRPAAEQTDRRPRRGRRPACAVGGAYPLCAQTFAERDSEKRGAKVCPAAKTRSEAKFAAGLKAPEQVLRSRRGLDAGRPDLCGT